MKPGNEESMKNARKRLMAWSPGAPGYSHDEVILAVGMQCKTKSFSVRNALSWLGTPNKATGNASGGHLAYDFDADTETVAMFDIADGKVIGFGTVTRNRDNVRQIDEQTGQDVRFNILDGMFSFEPSSFS